VSQLASARLVVTSRNSSGQETVEVVHEALIRHWQLLQGWIDENRSKIIQKNRIERLATEWQQNKQLNDYLLQGKQLKEAQAFQKEEFLNFALSDLACEFIKKSIKYERKRALKTASFFAIPLLIAFVGVVPVIRQANERQAWNTIREPKNPGVREALELLRQGCWARSEWSWMPDFLVTFLFGNCADFIGAKLIGANLMSADLRTADLRGADLSHAFLPNADLRGANLRTAFLANANLISADLSFANLYRTSLNNADLRSAKLRSAKLISADLRSANLSNAHLERADLNRADLPNTNLSGAHLERADLSRTDLRSAKLISADLRSANLKTANISGAHLERANLSGAILGCSTLFTEKFVCTNLKEVKNLTSQQIKAAKNWEQACYDPELRKQLNLPPENPKYCAGDLPK
jgi:uncharacterized protein YjbI with pentapeptide repeats